MATPIRGYMAASLDGFIADPDGGVEWLKPFEKVEYGFREFFAEIGTAVFGRATYEQSLGFPGPWTFAGKQCLVVTSQPLADPPPGVEAWQQGVGEGLVRRLQAAEGGDAWIVGGARLQGALFDLDAIDRFELFVIPVLLGDGVPMFPKSARRHRFDLTSARSLPEGMLYLDYRRRA